MELNSLEESANKENFEKCKRELISEFASYIGSDDYVYCYQQAEILVDKVIKMTHFFTKGN